MGQVPYFGMYWRDQRNHTIKDCGAPVRLVVTALKQRIYSSCHCGLVLVSLVQGKPMKFFYLLY